VRRDTHFWPLFQFRVSAGSIRFYPAFSRRRTGAKPDPHLQRDGEIFQPTGSEITGDSSSTVQSRPLRRISTASLGRSRYKCYLRSVAAVLQWQWQLPPVEPHCFISPGPVDPVRLDVLPTIHAEKRRGGPSCRNALSCKRHLGAETGDINRRRRRRRCRPGEGESGSTRSFTNRFSHLRVSLVGGSEASVLTCHRAFQELLRS